MNITEEMEDRGAKFVAPNRAGQVWRFQHKVFAEKAIRELGATAWNWNPDDPGSEPPLANCQILVKIP